MDQTVNPQTQTAKGQQTRGTILETALRLFQERGYQQTTMRAIATEAGVSLGNAYYYFSSKEVLIQAFYERTHREHIAECAAVLQMETDLKRRLHGVMIAKLDTIEPYHRFAGILFKTAADPMSPLNPFSAESRPVREEATSVFADVLDGSKVKVPKRLRSELPNLLWTYHMAVILYWIHDTSPGCRNSYRLAEQTVDLVVKLIGMARLPLLRPLITRALSLVSDLRVPNSAEV
jgi:AcrR family transcriptional regulator